MADTREMDCGDRPIGPPWANQHDRLDEIRRRMAVAAAKKVDEDLTLLEVPRRNIRRWAELWGYMMSAYAEWSDILERPWPEIRGLLIADNEDSRRLRQSTPFVGILTSRERKAIHATVSA